MTDLTPRYTLQSLADEQSARWDELIAPYESAQLFHRSPWLDYLAASRRVDVRLWAIKDLETTVGYFSGGLVKKGPFLVLGSPLKGWGTNYMGPVAGRDLDQRGFLRALDDLARRENLAMAEIESPLLTDDALSANGFSPVPGWTYRVTLDADQDRMWHTLDSTARNRIRKAIKAGLIVEDTDDQIIADEFFDQYSALVQEKGFAPPYPRDYPRLLLRFLKKADLLFALRVRDASGRVLATGLFPHDDHAVYFWGGASQHEGRDLCPNELLHWSLMRLAAARGLRGYDMCGHGQFKRKFGGELVDLRRWHKCYWQSARWARHGYELYHRARRRVSAWAPAYTQNGDPPKPLKSQRYVLEPLSASELARWDELVAPYTSRELFHRKVWLDYLAASRGVQPRFWTLRERGATVGYLSGAVVQKGPFRILGSPLKGWGTNFMGPLVNDGVDQPAFLRAVDRLAEDEGIAMVEMENPILSAGEMSRFGYESVSQPTYLVSLTPGHPNTMWDRLDLKSRQKVRKSKKNGLTVEETDDRAITDVFYDQFVEVLGRKNLFPPYDRACPRVLFDLLKPLGLLYALRVRDSQGEIVATGLFPHDDRSVYMWGAASRISAWRFSPNDLLQWALMERAAADGLTVYNMCGFGYFKNKFGGELIEPRRWHKFNWRSARWARGAYEKYFQHRIRLQSWWHRSSVATSEEEA